MSNEVTEVLNTAVEAVKDSGVVEAAAEKVTILKPAQIVLALGGTAVGGYLGGRFVVEPVCKKIYALASKVVAKKEARTNKPEPSEEAAEKEPVEADEVIEPKK